MNKLIFLVLGLLTQLQIGCEKVDSDLVTPENIYFDAKLSMQEEFNPESSSVLCITTPYQNTSGSPKVVDLIDGDKLTCNGVRMRRIDTILVFNYQAVVPRTTDNNYTINYFRKNEQFGAVSIQPH